MRKSILILGLLLACLFPARAQFYLVGDDPGHLRWYSVESAHYQIIYPAGTDSLARNYARALEQFRVPLGRSLGGMTPGDGQRRKLPVLLHAYYPYSNGSVGWAPSRMDLYTHPDAYVADPIPWHLQLAAHEPRHQAQIQFGQRGVLPWITGQIWAPVYWQLYLEQGLGEGDAVVAETGLASGTRARTADFLSYYRVALDQGKYKSWDRWRYGSFKHYTPDHYALGYVTLAGARTLYDSPLLVRESLDLAWKKPWYFAPYNTRKVISQHAGKPFKKAFKDIQESFNEVWQAEAEARAPFLEARPVTRDEAYANEYISPQWTEYGILALRKSYRRPAELVLIRQGRVRRLRSFASNTSSLYYNARWNRLFWSETRSHPRWGLDGSSVVCYYDMNYNRVHQLTRGTCYYSPQPTPDGERLAVMELPVQGGSFLVVLDASTGKVLRRVSLPAGVQGTEQAWLGEDIYVSGISQEGFGLYRLSPEGKWSCVLAASAQKMTNLRSVEDALEWVSDRSGVNELYRWNPADGRLQQLTSYRYGATGFTRGDGMLYGITQTLEGKQLFCTPENSLQPREVSFADVATHPIEDALTAQELALGAAPDLSADVPLSQPKRYSKLAHALRLHSWLPLYVNYDAVKSNSMDLSYETASLGLSAFFQNTLGTFSGMIGWAIHPDPDAPSVWRNALHLKMTYSGLYPVFEASLDLGDRQSRMYLPLSLNDGGNISYALKGIRQSWPLFSASVRAYLPLSFMRGGTHFGFTPQIKYSYSTNLYVTTPAEYSLTMRLQGLPNVYPMPDPPKDLTGPGMQHISASLRGYVMSSRAASQTYPRWGIGLEGGVGLRPGLGQYYAPNLYGYAYGYLPGFTRLQGLKWTFMAQSKMNRCIFGDLYANTLPRGFGGEASTFVGQYFPWQWKITADYAIPIYVGEINIPAVAYIKNFLLTPHADYTGLAYNYNLWSVGADLSASLARLLFLPFDASIGVSFSYLGGSVAPYLELSKPYSLSFIFGIDF